MTEQTWRKSSFSGSQANCIEVGQDGAGLAVRDSKDPGQVLTFDSAAWRRFMEQVRKI